VRIYSSALNLIQTTHSHDFLSVGAFSDRMVSACDGHVYVHTGRELVCISLVSWKVSRC
jgi:hypothetical protein